MKDKIMTRITSMLMRVMLLIIVGAYIYLKSTAAVTASTEADETSVVLKAFESSGSQISTDTLSYDAMLVLEHIRAEAYDISQYPPFPGPFYIKKIK
ncbi:hypothetical protein [Chitinophaga sp. S165]|uniref:hypothetical protein n=1 Tax=Chitinophaga sp. S165 TaxID=2135462 RepID=UPI000D71BAD3|nr:hypothetical protein [Chitinophaga sp. S165]